MTTTDHERGSPEATVGVRELRGDLAAHVRRAAAGHRTVVTSGGRAVAQLGPVEDTGAAVSVETLAAAGLLVLPRRTDAARVAPPVPIWSGVRLDRALRELRG